MGAEQLEIVGCSSRLLPGIFCGFVFGGRSEVQTLSLYHFFGWLSQQSWLPPGRDYNCRYWSVGFSRDVLPKANRFYHEVWMFLLKNTTKPRILRMVATPWGDKLHSFSMFFQSDWWMFMARSTWWLHGYVDQNLNLRPPADFDHFLPLSLTKHGTIFLGVSMSRTQNINWWVMKGVIPPGYMYIYIYVVGILLESYPNITVIYPTSPSFDSYHIPNNTIIPNIKNRNPANRPSGELT